MAGGCPLQAGEDGGMPGAFLTLPAGARGETHFSSSVLPHFGQAGTVSVRTSASKGWPQVLQL